jgi:hypothetical protein
MSKIAICPICDTVSRATRDTEGDPSVPGGTRTVWTVDDPECDCLPEDVEVEDD